MERVLSGFLKAAGSFRRSLRIGDSITRKVMGGKFVNPGLAEAAGRAGERTGARMSQVLGYHAMERMSEAGDGGLAWMRKQPRMRGYVRGIDDSTKKTMSRMQRADPAAAMKSVERISAASGHSSVEGAIDSSIQAMGMPLGQGPEPGTAAKASKRWAQSYNRQVAKG